MAKGRPGILLYFETVEPLLTQLNDEQAGRLFRASFDYAQHGITPSFSDALLSMAWAVMKPCIDRDEERYNETVLQKKYAVYSRECKRHEAEALSFEEYKALSTDNSRHRPITGDNGCYQPYPTTTTNTTTNPTSTTTYKGVRRSRDDLTQVAECDEAEFEDAPEAYDRPANDSPDVAEAHSVLDDEDDGLPF